jgi:integrase
MPNQFLPLAKAVSWNIRFVVLFMLDCGIRPCELYKLEASHFYEDKKQIILPAEIAKGNRIRVIYLSSVSFRIIRKLVRWYPNGKLFRTAKGSSLTKGTLDKALKRACEKLKWPTVRATDLRHSYAHYRITSGQTVDAIARLMGHKDATMIHRVYGHLEDSAWLTEQADVVQLPKSRIHKTYGRD